MKNLSSKPIQRIESLHRLFAVYFTTEVSFADTGIVKKQKKG